MTVLNNHHLSTTAKTLRPTGCDTQVRYNIFKIFLKFQKMFNDLIEIWTKFKFIKIQNKPLRCVESDSIKFITLAIIIYAQQITFKPYN